MIIHENVKMSEYTTFRTGGEARRVIFVESEEDIVQAVKMCEEEEEPYCVLGNGSNVLVSDRGYQGTVIVIGNAFSGIEVLGNLIYAKAGALLSKIAVAAREHALSGFEFASGIPGTLGGAIVMNAGAYGGEMKFVVDYVDAIVDGIAQRFSAEEMHFDYRHSLAMERKMIIIGAGIRLVQEQEKDGIAAKMKELNARRVEKQPLEYPSAGSTFKRPKDKFAGKLIEESGLKGYTVGGAAVSMKHAGFVINQDRSVCTSADIYQLIMDVQRIVEEKQGVKLIPEVQFIGEF